MSIGPSMPLRLEKPEGIDLAQAARYFGARGGADAATQALLEKCAVPLLAAATPRAVWLEADPDSLTAEGILAGEDVAKHRRGLVEITGQGAVVGHVADGQAGQIAGDTQLGYLHDRQGQGVSAVGLPGEGGGAIGIDAAVGHGFLIGAFLPEFYTDILAAGGTGTDSQHQQQHQRDQRCAGAFECVFHKDQPFLAARVRPALVSCWGRTQGLSTPKYHASDNMSICFVGFSQKSFTYEIKSRKNIRSPVREADIVKPLRLFAPDPVIGEASRR